MTAARNEPQRAGYGRAADAPNTLQRWVLAEAHPLATAALAAAALTALAVLFAVARGGTFTVNPVVLAGITWTCGTIGIAALMSVFGWTRNRTERVVKYLPPFPWSKSQ